MLGHEGSWGVVGASTSALVICSALYLLWKHHPSYGANPGLPSFPLLGSVPLVLLNKHRFYDWSCELFDRARSLTIHVFIGPLTIIATADPRNVQHILKSHFDSYPKGPSFYPYFFDLFGSGIFNCDGPLWRFQRKVASHIFTSNSLKDFVIEIGDAEIRHRLLPALDSACATQSVQRPIDLQALFMDFTFDTISQLTFGADPVCLVCCKYIKSKINDDVRHEKSDVKADAKSSHGVDGKHNGSDHHTSYMKVPKDLIQGFAQGFPLALQITADRFLTPNFIWQTKRSLRTGSEKKLLDALEAVNKFTSFVIEKSKSDSYSGDGNERKDLLSRFMRLSRTQVESLLEGEDEAAWKANTDGHEQTLSDALLKNILLSFILAGRDTVSSGLTFFIWQLCLYPAVEIAVYDEIKEIMRDRGSRQSMETFSFEELKKMNYLQAALSEAMRLYPPIPSDPKYAAQDDVLPDGTQVLQGYQVSYNVFAMGRAQKVWGEDCLEFKPERWFGEDGQFVAANPYKYPVFQAGPRICLGKDFAFIQMKLVIANLVRNFEFKLSSGFKPKLSYGVTLSMRNGLPVTVKRRQHSLRHV